MIGILVKFLEFMKLETDRINLENSKNFKPNTQQKSESSELIEISEKENVYKEQSEIVTKFENGKAIKVQITTQLIPVSKTSAIQKTSVQRLERGI